MSPSDAPSPTEVSVAINPARPENIIAVTLQTVGPGTDFAYVSFDGGNNWASVQGPNPHGRTQGDDVVVFDLRIRLVRIHPLLVRPFLWPLLVQLRNVRSARLFDTTLARKLLQIRFVAFPRVSTND